MQKLTLNIQGMTCSHCERAVKNAVASLTGVKSIEVNLKNNNATIEFDESIVTLPQIKKAISEEGYQA